MKLQTLFWSFALAPATLLGQYVYHYSDTLTSIGYVWTQNGSALATPYGLTATSASGGSLIYGATMPGPTGEYETAATLNLTASGGTYVLYLNASGNALSGPSNAGTYYDVEVQPTFAGSSCTAAISLNKNGSGGFTTLTYTYVSCGSGMVIRAVHTYSSQLVVYVNGTIILYAVDSELTAGQPGVGARNTPSGSSVSLVQLGQLDQVSPNPINTSLIGISAFPNRVDLQFPGTSDNTGGTGIAFYQILKNSAFLSNLETTEFSDTAVSPSTTYQYLFVAYDFHLNVAETGWFNVTTPPAGAVDSRRVGVRSTGAYWGASPEQLDVLSGNLSYSVPLLQARARSASVGFSLSYNSQNWRQDPAGLWNLGRDVGYGYGWKLLAGSITPYWNGYYTLDHWTFTDSTGAEYRLSINTGNVWTSADSVYLSYDANTNILHFPDGTYWVMGATSAGQEQDAGTYYPTVMEDTNGNQILIKYATGIGVSWPNSSARITTIEDVRATNQGGTYYTYSFGYNSDPIPHLTSIANTIGTGESYSFTYSSFSLVDPYVGASFGTSTALAEIQLPLDNYANYQFTTSASGEVTKAKLIYGGYIRWAYQPYTYSGSRVQREIGTRYLSKDGTGETAYAFGHESDTGSQNVHSYTYIDDPGGVSQKSWAFSQSGSNIGLAILYHGKDLSTGTNVVENDYTWTQDSAGNNYIGTVVSYLDSTSVSTSTTQTLDTNGNVTQVVKHNYSGLSPASRTYTYTYLNSSNYTSRYIFNRLTSATVTDGTNNATLASITYDGGGVGTGASPTPREWDGNYATIAYRGNPTAMTTPSGPSGGVYDMYGNVSSTTVNGVTSTVSTASTTNYAAPTQITVGSSLTTNLSYVGNEFLGVTNESGPNGTSVGIGYDSNARPTSTTSPFGATTTTSYNDTASPPNTCTIVDGRWTQTNLDGLGRPILTITGYGSSCGSGTFVSQAETTYGSAATSPLGNVISQAIPHAYGTGASATTTYTYDAIGRTISKAVVGSDTQGTTTYAYYGQTWGAQLNVYDPAGNWKVFYTDAFGNLSQVAEPNPSGGANYLTSYTYDLLNHLTGVSMPRPSGTQTRSFTYSGDLLTSATNPESGTVNYSYNSYNKVAQRTDAKSQVTTYTYDTLARLTEVQKYPSGLSGGEDTCQRVVYTYDGSVPPAPPYGYPVSTTYPQNAQGHLSGIQYSGGYWPGASPACDTTFTELFTYGVPGSPTGKLLQVNRVFGLTYIGNTSYGVTLTAGFGYDTEGRLNSIQYPSMSDEWNRTTTGATLGYAFDSMGRVNTLTNQTTSQQIITAASYGPANEITSITGATGGWGTETSTYNSLKQLIGISSPGVSATYAYPATGNAGKIVSETDGVSGETVTYAYDSLSRLISASNQTGFTPSWGQGFTYDGFGNLTNVAVTKGSAPAFTLAYDANNHVGGEDANGNPGTILLAGYGTTSPAAYDVENRLMQTASGTINYSYAPDNHRVWRGTGTFTTQSGAGSGQCNTGEWTTDEITFWAPNGQKLGTFQLAESPTGSPSGSQCSFTAAPTGSNYYFAGKLISNANGWVYTDHLSSIGKFYPYGIERPSATANGTEKFTGYIRDTETGNDYAINRYASPGFGRFLTPDRKSGRAASPGSWNKYAYTRGDPINRVDPYGLCDSFDANCIPDEGGNTDNVGCWVLGVDPEADNNPAAGALCSEEDIYGDSGSASPSVDPTLPVFSYSSTSTCPPNCGTSSPTDSSTSVDASEILSPVPVTASQANGESGGSSSQTTQTLAQCMQANANTFSIAGGLNHAFNKVFGTTSLAFQNNGLVQALLGNPITALTFGTLQDSATAGATATPGIVALGMGTVTSYGRRTSTVMSLNLAGKGGLPLALGSGSTAVKSAIAGIGDALSAGMSLPVQIGVNLAISGLEAGYCASK